MYLILQMSYEWVCFSGTGFLFKGGIKPMSRLKRLEVVKMLVFSRHIEISAQDANTWDQKRWWLRKQYGVNAVLSCFCWCLHTLKQKSWCTAREEGGLMREKKGSDKDEREREREREVWGKKQRDGGKASCLVTEAEGEEGERRWRKERKCGGGGGGGGEVWSCFPSAKS